MPRRNPLVTQHLEHMSRRVLEEYQDVIRECVRRREGVYVLYRRGKLYYVGLASNLKGRLGHHLKDRHRDSWDSFSVYLTIGDSHLRELESLIIRITEPAGNKQKGKFAKSEDLRSRFRRDYKRLANSRLDELFGKIVRRVGRKVARKKEAGGRKGKAVVLSRYLSRPIKLRGTHKGKTIRATVRKSGLIYYDKQHFTSPSNAARHAVKRRTCNGWTFWHYELSPGHWVPLDHLRR